MEESLVDKVAKFVDTRWLLQEWREISKICPEHTPIESKSNFENILVEIQNGLKDIPDGVKTKCSSCGNDYQRPYNLEERKRIAEVYGNLQIRNSNEYNR